MTKVSSTQQMFAQMLGVGLLVPTLVFVLGCTSQRLTFMDPCVALDVSSSSLFDYAAFYSCAQVLPSSAKATLLFVWLIILISLLASTADLFFVPQLDAMSGDLGLAEDVAGVTLLALGNGMPDVMTATSSIIKADDFALTMGEMLGAANWILSLVFGCCLLLKTGPTKVDPSAFMRDSMAYAVVLLFMVGLTWDGMIYLRESMLFVALYGMYVAIVVLPSRFGRRKSAHARELSSGDLIEDDESPADRKKDRKNSDIELQARHEGSAPATFAMDDDDDDDTLESFDESDSMEFMLLESDSDTAKEDDDFLEGFTNAESIFEALQITIELPFTIARHASIPAANWNRKRRALAAGCPIFSSMLLLLSFGGWEAFGTKWGYLPLWLCCIMVSAIFSIGILLFSRPEQRPRWHCLLLLLAFLCTIGWFNLLASECVAVLEFFGLKFGISSSVLGITVLAWGNSVGDLVADVALVRQGKSRMAIAGIFGSPLLSDLLGLGVSCTSYNLTNGKPLHVSLSKSNKVAAGFLVSSIAISVLTFAYFRFSCPRRLGYVLVAHYAIFMIVSILGESSVFYHMGQEHSLTLAGGSNETLVRRLASTIFQDGIYRLHPR